LFDAFGASEPHGCLETLGLVKRDRFEQTRFLHMAEPNNG
jgi:hypothetical protein